MFLFFFQAEDGIRYLVRSRGLGDVYKRQWYNRGETVPHGDPRNPLGGFWMGFAQDGKPLSYGCLLYTSDAADERSSVDLGGRRIIKKKKQKTTERERYEHTNTKSRGRD